MEYKMGKIIKLNRIQLKIKQEYLAKKLDMANSYYSRVENNVHDLNENQIMKVFDALGLDYDQDNQCNDFEVDFLQFTKDIICCYDIEDSFNKLESYYPNIRTSISYPK